MYTLGSIKPIEFSYKNDVLRVNSDFRVVFNFIHNFKKDEQNAIKELLPFTEKLAMLIFKDDEVKNKQKTFDKLIVEYLAETLKELDLVKKEAEEQKEMVMDIKKDARHIRSSFLKCYGLDLDNIKFYDYRSFMADLEGLKDTKINDIIEIRQFDISKLKGEDRDRMIKAKMQYSLIDDISEDDVELTLYDKYFK